MARNDQLLRHLNIIRYLDSKYGVTMAQLISKCGVTRRTIERDLATLQEVGFPITQITISGHSFSGHSLLRTY